LLRRWHDELQKGPEASAQVARELIDRFSQRTLPAAMMDPKANAERTADVWTEHTSIVERYNKPGKFTAFMGFEYTLTPNGDNLHRVVILRDGKDKADKVIPYTSLVGTSADMLWDYMDGYEKKTGGKMLAIPHNSNLSNGLMFQMTMPGGGPMTADYARRRASREPIVEATQIKGDSETHPFLSPNDEFASFGKAGWDIGNLDNSVKKTNDMFAGDYVREALKRGLLIEKQTGVNPYKLGMIGSTDSHTALAIFVERAECRARFAAANVGYAKGGTIRLELSGRRLCGGLGKSQHAHRHFRRDDAARGLCHDWTSYDCPLLWGLGLFGQRPQT
jgi:Protein of unknown function (DUF3604)